MTRAVPTPGRGRTRGFAVSFRFDPALDDAACRALLARFVAEALEARGLAYGGGEHAFVTCRNGASATEADRAAVARWLRGCAGVQAVVVGPCEDDTLL